MTVAVIILVGALCLVGGFIAGVRYCAAKLLPGVIARMSPRELSRVVNEAGKLKRLDEHEQE